MSIQGGPCPFRAGDRIRIIDGPLAKRTGVFIRAAPNGRCVITIDGDGMSASVIVSAASLELQSPPTA